MPPTRRRNGTTQSPRRSACRRRRTRRRRVGGSVGTAPSWQVDRIGPSRCDDGVADRPEPRPALRHDVGVDRPRCRRRRRRARRTPSPGGGRGGCRARAPWRPGAGSMRSPSSVTVDVGAGRAQLGREVAEAVALLGPDEADAGDRRSASSRSTATAASVGTRSETSAMSTSMPRSGTAAVARRRRARRRRRSTVQPIAAEQVGERDVALQPSRGAARRPATRPPATAAMRQRVAGRRASGSIGVVRAARSAPAGTTISSSPTSTPSTPNAAITAAVSATYGADTSGVVSAHAQPAVEQRGDQHQRRQVLAATRRRAARPRRRAAAGR